MSVALVKDLLGLIDVTFAEITSIPCITTIEDGIQLAVFMTEFDHLSFTMILNPDAAISWSDSDITEYFLDDETQYFIEEFNAAFTKTGDSVGFSHSVKPEKAQIIELSNFVKKSAEELNRFLTDYTAI